VKIVALRHFTTDRVVDSEETFVAFNAKERHAATFAVLGGATLIAFFVSMICGDHRVIKLADYRRKYQFFKLDRSDEGVLAITFHTDGGPMVWGLDPLEQLGYLWADVASDAENKVIIVTGTGDGFIPSMAVSSEARMSALTWEKIASDVRRVIRNHLSIGVPMIAAVNGPTRFHSEQALLCDIVIVSSNTEFQDSPHFISGMVPGDGVQIIYQHLMGANRARYFLFMGEIIPAQMALERGLISEVHAPQKLPGRALEIARHLLKQPELVRRYTRQVATEPLRRLYSQYLDHGLALEGLGAWGGWPFESGASAQSSK
jgi:enoyl-CoA hydratase/carnithine racemase